MNVIKSQDVIGVVRSMLDLIDERLVHHGDRVAYLCLKIMEYLNYSYEKKNIGLTLAEFHDIGAYKTDEIDDLLSFESKDVWEHAIYGYLFLLRLSPLSQYADCILYHHLDYHKLMQTDCSHKDITNLIHFCDRIDVLFQYSDFDSELFSSYTENKFKKEFVEAFLVLNQDNTLFCALKDGSYTQDIDEFIKTFVFSNQEKKDYLSMLAYSIDFNSEFTVYHTIMTTRLSVELAKYFQLSDEELEKIFYGSLLHDVGKAAIPINILEKAGKLTDAEMDIMKTHVAISEKMLKGHIPDDILKIAIRHHEKLDGSGYPYGISACDLSLSECIVAVADILSALLSRRSYKEAFKVEDACRIVSDMAKQGFISQNVVDMFILHHEDIVEKTKQFTLEQRTIYEAMNADYLKTYQIVKTIIENE